MHWVAVILAAFIVGLVEFWRLCRTAPLMYEDGFEPQSVASRPAETLQQSLHHDEAPSGASVDTPPSSGVSGLHGPTVLDEAQAPVPKPLWKPINLRQCHEAGQQ